MQPLWTTLQVRYDQGMALCLHLQSEGDQFALQFKHIADVVYAPVDAIGEALNLQQD